MRNLPFQAVCMEIGNAAARVMKLTHFTDTLLFLHRRRPKCLHPNRRI